MPRARVGDLFEVYYEPAKPIPPGHSIRGVWEGPMEAYMDPERPKFAIESADSEKPSPTLSVWIVRGRSKDDCHPGTYDCVATQLLDESRNVVGDLTPRLDGIDLERSVTP
jgi:hypothetical protein